jgi:hypothetical protein
VDDAHDFTLVLHGVRALDDALSNRVYRACPDAALSCVNGVVRADFARPGDRVKVMADALVALMRVDLFACPEQPR